MLTQDTLEAELKQAIEHHQAGRFEDAETHYRVVLQVDPNHPVANHNLGALMVRMKQAEAALSYFLAALDADPASGQYWTSYIDALYQAGQIEEARQILEMAQQQGLQGPEVDALVETVMQHAADPSGRPGNREIDALVALFGQGRLSEAASLAKQMTVRYPQHEFGWKALGAVYKQMGRTEDALVPMQKAAALSPGDVEAHYNLGVTLQELARLEEAETCYRHALQINPGYADAHANLGVILQALGRLDEAEASCRRAMEVKPNYVPVLGNLANILKELGRLEEAEDCCRQVLQLTPDSAEAYFNLGNVLRSQGRLEDAEICFRQSLEKMPGNVAVHFNLGNVLKDMGRLVDAEACYRRVLDIDPNVAQVHYNLGNILLDLRRLDEAEASYRRAIQLKYDYSEAHYNLGNVLRDVGRLSDAEYSYRQAIAFKSDYAEAYSNLGVVLQQMGRLEEAEASCRKAIEIIPDYVAGLSNLGVMLQKCGRPEEAVTYFQKALSISPDYTEAHKNLGVVSFELNRLDEAGNSFKRAMQLDVDNAVIHSNLIFTRDLMDDVDAVELSAERRRWNERHAVHLHQHRGHDNVPDPNRKLRVAYVSADFRMHSAAYAFGAMLVDFDREQFEVFAYSNSRIEDSLTAVFRQNVTHWKNVVDISDDALSNLIRDDQIDILVDLSAHSAGNRLLAFARKPAPIQITAWGYGAGTGMTAMDVFFTDAIFVPPEEKSLYAEQVRYLPCAIGAYFNIVCPEVNALPALSAGKITFGSFNRLVKMNKAVYAAWAQILHAIPDSRMIIKTPALDDAAMREKVMAYFTQDGIAAERIVLLGKTSREEHLAAYNQIDMVLDPFPHGGGVSALEGLMMGVPAITLLWPTLPGRVSASFLTLMGLTDWIAKTKQQYVELAIQKASDLQSLSELRQQLRGIYTTSVIGDQAAYVKIVEREYRQLWQEWCETGDARNSS